MQMHLVPYFGPYRAPPLQWQQHYHFGPAQAQPDWDPVSDHVCSTYNGYGPPSVGRNVRLAHYATLGRPFTSARASHVASVLLQVDRKMTHLQISRPGLSHILQAMAVYIEGMDDGWMPMLIQSREDLRLECDAARYGGQHQRYAVTLVKCAVFACANYFDRCTLFPMAAGTQAHITWLSYVVLKHLPEYNELVSNQSALLELWDRA